MIDAAALAIPSILAAGLLLIFLGVTRTSRPRAAPLEHVRDWLRQSDGAELGNGQLVLSCAAAGLLSGVLLLVLTRSAAIAAAFAFMGGRVPVLWLRGRRRKLNRERQAAWPHAIEHLASGVGAGLSLPEAVRSLAERGPSPLRAALSRFAAIYDGSGRFGDALDALKEDLADPTADRVIEALRVAREVGGSELGRTLRTLAKFVRDEQQVRLEVEARQSWVLVAARLAFASPWLALLLLVTKPEADVAYRSTGGALVVGTGATLAITGYWLMLRIGRLPTEERVLQ